MKAKQISRRTLLKTGLGSLALGVIPVRPSLGDPKAVKVSVLTSPSGSGPYNAWATLQTYAPQYHPWLRPIAVETPGFTYNVKFMAQSPKLWETTLFGSGEVVQWAAVQGIKPFFPSPLAAAKDFRFVGVMSRTSNIWVTLDPAIKTPNDFVGKRIATGLLTQNEWGMHERMFLDWWGITPKLAAFEPLGPNPNIEAMLDGRADVGTLLVHSNHDMSENLLPGPFKTLESAHRSWSYVNVPTDMIKPEIDRRKAPFLIRSLRADLLPKQPQPFTSFGENMPLSAHKSFPDELAYEFAKLWIKMGPQISKFTAISKIWDAHTISIIAREKPEVVHPGAMKAYKELGLV
jgi:TRAP-type uncharacterized transport system substrate-binding protein